MTASGKVLTVSYGAFSCTLEGFDEPFAAMTSIVSYFQKLAKADVHFGSVPLQPDLEALRLLASQSGQEVEAVQLDAERFVLRGKEAEPAVPATIASDLPMPSGVAAKLASLRDALLNVVTQSKKADLPLAEDVLSKEAFVELKPEDIAQTAEAPRAKVIRIHRSDLPEEARDLETPAKSEAPSNRSILSGTVATDVDRLMQQVEAQMASPSNQRRVASIQHLKAAVAAKVTEARGDGLEKLQSDEAAPEILPPEEPAQTRLAPLVLDAAQRVDDITTAPAPLDDFDLALQKALEIEVEQSPAISFAEFVKGKPFNTQVQRLELAARYVEEVEKRPLFERPYVMRLSNSLETESAAVSREDALRAFGTLLRQGRIIKAGRGTYKRVIERHEMAE